jgi:hypothetical protein
MIIIKKLCKSKLKIKFIQMALNFSSYKHFYSAGISITSGVLISTLKGIVIYEK